MPLSGLTFTETEATSSISFEVSDLITYTNIPRDQADTPSVLTQIFMYETEKPFTDSFLIFKDILRELKKVFSQVKYRNPAGEIVGLKAIHGTPDRITSELQRDRNLILPLISIQHTGEENDDARRRTDAQIIPITTFNSKTRRYMRILTLAPRPININYKINIWVKNMEEFDQITAQIYSKFNPALNIRIPTQFKTQAYLGEVKDISVTNTGDREDRVLRKEFNISVETYIPTGKYLFTNTGQIERVNIDAFFFQPVALNAIVEELALAIDVLGDHIIIFDEGGTRGKLFLTANAVITINEFGAGGEITVDGDTITLINEAGQVGIIDIIREE